MAVKEIEMLERMEAWEIVDHVKGMNVIDSIWAFKLKHYLDGTSKKFKARFCARGDNSWKELISSKLMLRWFNGPPSTYC